MILTRKWAVQIKVDRSWRLHSAAEYSDKGTAEQISLLAAAEQDVEDVRLITLTTTTGRTEQEDLLAEMITRIADQQGRLDAYKLGAFEMAVAMSKIVHDEDWSSANARVAEAVQDILADRD